MVTHVPIARLKSMSTLKMRNTASGAARRHTDRRVHSRRLGNTVTGMVPTNASGAVQQVRVTPAPSAQQEFTRSKFVSMKAHSLLGLSKNAFVRQYGEFTYVLERVKCYDQMFKDAEVFMR